ncbi:exosortase A [Sphingorhabdus soli]|uniref:Exosortase A n=1 Tax=Flavisphingopyxis soli TaxID=2601267 RepID=A0A5C6U7X4_9SPHN|nr:exosortase A [Sphingorhabdus soli]TXC68914.1 exosortase A [Sphingorhabdus soli]
MTAVSMPESVAPDVTAPAWRTHAMLLGAATLALLALFWRDAAHMASIWWTSSTFNHCLLIIPILYWLVQQRWPVLRTMTPTVWLAGLLLVAAGSIAWLLGEAGGVSLARHLGLVLMLQGAVVTLLGRQVSRALLFPIAYALFLVPFGEEFVPALQTLTAKMAMVMLGWAGIPAHIEGVFITTPHGWFQVAEACSGVKFVIAMLALGALAAHLLFRRWGRRIGFIALALVVPILANGVRAFATIWYAERYGVEHAAGFDHVIYGWVFFAVVIAIVLVIGTRFADRDGTERVDAVPAVPERGGGAAWPAALALVVIAALPPAWLAMSAGRAPQLAEAYAAPAVPGWQLVASADAVPWQPHFAGSDSLRRFTYADPRGRRVDLIVAAFARQAEGREIVGYGRGALDSDHDWVWSGQEHALGDVTVARLIAPGAVREVASVYRVGSEVLADPKRVKLATLVARLLGRDQRSAAVIVSAVATPQQDAAQAIRDFRAAAGPFAALADAALETR